MCRCLKSPSSAAFSSASTAAATSAEASFAHTFVLRDQRSPSVTRRSAASGTSRRSSRWVSSIRSLGTQPTQSAPPLGSVRSSEERQGRAKWPHASQLSTRRAVRASGVGGDESVPPVPPSRSRAGLVLKGVGTRLVGEGVGGRIRSRRAHSCLSGWSLPRVMAPTGVRQIGHRRAHWRQASSKQPWQKECPHCVVTGTESSHVHTAHCRHFKSSARSDSSSASARATAATPPQLERISRLQIVPWGGDKG